MTCEVKIMMLVCRDREHDHSSDGSCDVVNEKGSLLIKKDHSNVVLKTPIFLVTLATAYSTGRRKKLLR
jgi:hypothetical protein